MGSGDDQPPPLTEHFWAVRWAMDASGAVPLPGMFGPLPEDRNARIAALRNAVSDGTYQVSPEQTAEAILAEQQVRDGTAA